MSEDRMTAIIGKMSEIKERYRKTNVDKNGTDVCPLWGWRRETQGIREPG